MIVPHNTLLYLALIGPVFCIGAIVNPNLYKFFKKKKKKKKEKKRKKKKKRKKNQASSFFMGLKRRFFKNFQKAIKKKKHDEVDIFLNVSTTHFSCLKPITTHLSFVKILLSL